MLMLNKHTLQENGGAWWSMVASHCLLERPESSGWANVGDWYVTDGGFTSCTLLFLQVKQVSALGQSGVISSQSVLSYQATGPTKNGLSPCANCNANNKRQTLGLRNSVLESEIQ